MTERNEDEAKARRPERVRKAVHEIKRRTRRKFSPEEKIRIVLQRLRDEDRTAPAFIILKAAERFAHPTMAVNRLWQTDFTYLKVMGWGWFPSTVLDDFSRYIIAWRCARP